jgi:hypothetical protein
MPAATATASPTLLMFKKIRITRITSRFPQFVHPAGLIWDEASIQANAFD